MSKDFSQSVEQFFLTVGQNNFGNKIPNLYIPDTLYMIKYLIIILIFCSLYPGIAAAPGVVPGGPSTAASQAHHLNQFVQPHPGYSVAQQQQQQQQALQQQQQAQMQR